LPDLGYEEPAPERINIAMITFAFNNAEFINLLRKRGTFLKFEKYDKVREVNNKIDTLKSDPTRLNQLNRPVTAFLSFENEEGINRMKEYNDTVANDLPAYGNIQHLLGEELDI
jgi:hypothetical protein